MTGVGRWTESRANEWYAAQPWLVGCNFIPSNAINELEMWQAATFDEAAIGRELELARWLGFNSVRVFLHDLPWADDAVGFTGRIDRLLEIAAEKGIRPMFVLFDDCWNSDPGLGPQPAPAPGRHNSGWVQSPGNDAVADSAQWPRLEAYVRGVVEAFGQDDRVLCWDIYNEVTNLFLVPQGLAPDDRRRAMAEARALRDATRADHLRLLDAAFAWARDVAPRQPVTAGVYMPDRELNEHLVGQSDIITFHCYGDAVTLEKRIERLRRYGRPIICTEYLARGAGSRFQTHLPIFERERVGCYNWGLVNGKTQTHFSWTHAGADEPDPWFHDIFRGDGTPYDAEETAFIRETLRAR
jgi:hypothetical protein